MSCIGTAGHVDHGKSTLVKALTGIDPDRLAEEKARGMTIDLGFAWLQLPGGREVSIVDVPGHESFIKNMLAGVGGIDAALFVVAADEGVMPQTREHLAILDLLGVQQGIVVLTKIDLVDEEWLALVREEVREALRGTTLETATILPVSAYSGQGLPELVQRLEQLLEQTQERQDIARPRLPIDRVFSMTGFGTVVTGTLLDGSFQVGQEVEVLPRGLKTRIRTQQTHRQQVEFARPGSRVALNLANVARSDLRRGDVVARPGQLRSTQLLDARIQLLTDAARPLAHNAQVDFYCGSQEVTARVRLLDVEELLPGQQAWAQLRLLHPVVVTRQDRFILRNPSPSLTLGGGTVVDGQPRYHRRFQSELIQALEILARGTPEELVLAALDRRRVATAASGNQSLQGVTGYDLATLARQSNLLPAVTLQALETLLTEKRVRLVGSYWFALPIWGRLVAEALRLVSEHHLHHPLRGGLSKEEWRARLQLSPRLANEVFQVLQAEGLLAEASIITGGLLKLPAFQPTFSAEQQRRLEVLLERFRGQPYMPPVRSEAEALAGADVVGALIEQGQIVRLNDGILFLQEAYEQALIKVLGYVQRHGKVTVAEARDLLGTTRKYVLPLLEHLDEQRITRRLGDERTLLRLPPGLQGVSSEEG